MKHPTSAAVDHELPGIRFWPRILVGLLVFVALIFAVGGWIATGELNGAVMAPGMIVVDQEMNSVQHRDGGIISEIAVREGDKVLAGQVLLRLEVAQTRAELSIVKGRIVELIARRARLTAEREGLAEISFPDAFNQLSQDAAKIADGELRLFTDQRINRNSQVQQLELGAVQIGEEIEGLAGQHHAKVDEIGLVQVEYDRNKSLFDRGLLEVSRL